MVHSQVYEIYRGAFISYEARGVINCEDNITIIPISLHQDKLRHVEESLGSAE